MRVVLFCFEVLSGLKVNFHKSLLVGVIVNDSRLNEVVSVMKCQVGWLSFMYLDLPIWEMLND